MGKTESKGYAEIETSEYILNLDYYLHRTILVAIDALSEGIKKGTPQEGLLNLTLAVSRAEGIAKAKKIIRKKEKPEELKYV